MRKLRKRSHLKQGWFKGVHKARDIKRIVHRVWFWPALFLLASFYAACKDTQRKVERTLQSCWGRTHHLFRFLHVGSWWRARMSEMLRLEAELGCVKEIMFGSGWISRSCYEGEIKSLPQIRDDLDESYLALEWLEKESDQKWQQCSPGVHNIHLGCQSFAVQNILSLYC